MFQSILPVLLFWEYVRHLQDFTLAIIIKSMTKLPKSFLVNNLNLSLYQAKICDSVNLRIDTLS